MKINIIVIDKDGNEQVAPMGSNIPRELYALIVMGYSLRIEGVKDNV